MIQATQIRPGMVLKWEGDLYSVFSMTHRTPGNLRAFVQVKMRTCGATPSMSTVLRPPTA